MSAAVLQDGYHINTRQAVVESLGVATVLTAVSYAVGLLAGWVENPDAWTLLEAFCVFTSYSCTYLCVKESRFNYPIGAVSTFAYAVLFWHFDLLASSVLNFYLTIQLAYGFWRWRSDTKTLPVRHVELKWIPGYIAVSAAFYFGAVFLVDLAGGELARTDSIILVFTIVAQFLLDNKKIETWFVWVVVNVFAIYTYFHADLNLAGFQYIFFLANTVYGYMIWKRSLDAQNLEA